MNLQPISIDQAIDGNDDQTLRAHMITKDMVDWSKYEHIPDAQNIKPAAFVREDLKKLFREGVAQRGTPLPWENTQDKFRIRPGEVTVWSGQNYSGKSILVSQVLAWVSCIEPVLNCSLEMPPVESMHRMVCQMSGLGLDKPSDEFLDYLMDWTIGRIYLLDFLGELAPTRIAAVINYAAQELGIKQIVIDSLMMTTIKNDDMAGQSQFINNLMSLAKANQIHIHLVTHSRKPADGQEHQRGNRYSIKGTGDISDKVDNVVIVWRNEKKEQAAEFGDTDDTDPDATMRIDKQRHFQFTGTFAFWFDKKSMQFCTNSNRRPLQWPGERGFKK